MRRARSLLLLVLGCGSASDPLRADVAAGDLVIALEERAGEVRAWTLLADERGVAELSREDGASLAVAIVPAREIIDLAGQPLDLSSVTVDLDGELAGACGCRVLPLEGSRLVLGAGDRCPLPPGAALLPVGAGADLSALRARLRIRAPGACACPSAPYAPKASAELCPLGEDAAAMSPVALGVAPDGTTMLVSRVGVVELAPDGGRRELALDPPIDSVRAVIAFDGGDALIISSHAQTSVGDDHSEYHRVSPRRGTRERLEGLPVKYDLFNVTRSRFDDEVWLSGKTRNGLGDRPVLARCRFTRESASCREVEIPRLGGCSQYNSGEGIDALTEIDRGEWIGAIGSRGYLVVRDGEVRCLPGSDRVVVRKENGELMSEVVPDEVVSAGRSLIACIDYATPEPHTLVAVATLGPPDAASFELEWRALRDGPALACNRGGRRDPRDPLRAVLATYDLEGHQRSYRITATSTRVEELEDGAELPELGEDIAELTTSSSASALISWAGEAWVRLPGAPRFVRRTQFPRPRGPVARAVARADDGFRVFTGGAASVRVRGGPSCAETRLELPAAALEVPEGVSAGVAVRLGADTLVFGKRDGRVVMDRYGDGDAPKERVALDGSAEVRAAVELVPGARVVLLRDDGSLWSSDGASVELLDGSGGWELMSGVSGAAWLVAADHKLGRVRPAEGGGLEVEPNALLAVDTSAFDAIERLDVGELYNVGALCDGRALLFYREQLTKAYVIRDFTAWELRQGPAGPALVQYAPLDLEGLRVLGNQGFAAVVGVPEAPITLFSRLWPIDRPARDPGAGVHSVGHLRAALPFPDVRGVASDGPDVLVGGGFLRMARVIVRPSAE